jgi:hypothetical protein
VTPVVGGWVRVRKRTRVRIVLKYFFNRVFELPSSRNAQKRDKKNREKVGFGFLVDFFVKTFRHDFFCGVFELPSLKNTRKRDKTKKVKEKLTSKFLSKFLNLFRHGLFVKYFYGVFELPLPRNAQKRTKNKSIKKKSDVGWVGLGFSKCKGGPSIFFCRPLELGKGRRRKKKKSDVPTYLPFLRFFEIFRSDLRKYFYSVFGLLMQRNGQKRD